MSYYWFNREELLKKAKEKYDNKGGKQKTGDYCKKNKEAVNEKQRGKYKKLTEEEKRIEKEIFKKWV